MANFKKIKTNPESGKDYRKKYFEGIVNVLNKKMDESSKKRDEFINPDSLAEHREHYQKKYCDMLGWPLNEFEHNFKPNFKKELLEELDFVTVYRLCIETLPDLWFEGTLYVPKSSSKKLPLTIINPGGGYFCEDLIAHGDYPSAQYRNIGGRFVEAGCMLFAPQLLIRNGDGFDFDMPKTRQFIDDRLKALGGSIAAIEIFNLKRAIDYFIGNEDIDSERIGMAGLSYGGFYTLYTSAADTRIKSTFSSCFFCGRFGYKDEEDGCRSDWLWQNSAETFFDAEVAALIAPRALYIENGKADEIFSVDLSIKEFERLKPFYERANAEDKLKYFVGNDGHIVDEGEQGIKFYLDNLFSD